MRFETLAIHEAQEADPSTGALVTPICQTSTFVQQAPAQHKGFNYSRTNNPTRETLEKVLAALEGVKYCAVYASGIAAENAIFQSLLTPGDHIITTPDIYGGTFRLLNDIYVPKGYSFSPVDLNDESALREAFRPSTKIVWLESPTNPRLQIYDIARAASIAHEYGALLVVDNTFASPVNQLPFQLGADIVVHSVTKYLAGHSDLIQGAVLAKSEEVFSKIKYLQNATGATASPFDCWLTLRGLKTLKLRVEKHNANAQAVAEYLEKHPRVSKVYYPGLTSHEGHITAQKQSRGYGGVVAIELNADLEATKRFASNLKYFKLGESLGGVKSLICHPPSMTHASIPAEERKKLGLADGLIRLSVGIEDVSDLIEDLESGIANLFIEQIEFEPPAAV